MPIKKPEVPRPWHPAAWEESDAGALQALQRGDATGDQQQRALRWIVETCAGTYDLSFRPGPEGARDSDLAEGKRFVGLQIVKLLKINLSQLRKATDG